MRNLKTAGIIFMLSLSLFWILGVLRFQFEWADVLFSIFLFPFGFLYWGYESYCIANLAPSGMWNNEFIQLGLFMIATAGQAAVFYTGYTWCQRKRSRKAVC